MCGIAGYHGLSANEALLETMNGCQQHRGPDGLQARRRLLRSRHVPGEHQGAPAPRLVWAGRPQLPAHHRLLRPRHRAPLSSPTGLPGQEALRLSCHGLSLHPRILQVVCGRHAFGEECR